MDFDICEKIEPGKHIIIGASAFFPPEIIPEWQADKKIAEFDLEKADVFSLGCTILGFINLFLIIFRNYFL